MRISKSLRLIAFLGLSASAVFGQGAAATVTGTISDPSGLAIANASVELKNADTGASYTAASTGTGNYAVPNLPVGSYTLTASAPGFKTYTHTNLALSAAQVLREDIPLQVGTATETVTVEAQATLLKTETGDQSTNITLEQLQDLPMLGVGTVNSGSTGVRNPYNVIQTIPGVNNYNLNTGGLFYVNGLGGGFQITETMRVEGQDATSRFFNAYDYVQMSQPNADAIQEVSYQTSNYAPEFGQAGNVVINMTMKSGTNAYHGSAFDYFVNEDLNSGYPYTTSASGSGNKVRPTNRRNDFGGTLGGPVSIPKIYNGKDRTFFFWAYEEYLESNRYSFTDTVPTADYLGGNFSHISPNGDCSLCAQYGVLTGPLGGINPSTGKPFYTDALGNPTFANEIFDPTTRTIDPVTGRPYAKPFTGNIIPQPMWNKSSVAIQKLFPAAQGAGLTNNYTGIVPGNRYSAIPSLKVDQIISTKDKVSFYWSRINTESQVSVPFGGADGLPLEIGQYRGTFIPNYTIRLNYDRTLTPTMLLHLGAGYYHTSFSDRAPELNFDPTSIGLSGFLIHRNFPVITGLCVAPSLFGASAGCSTQSGQNLGGMQQLGPGAGQSQTFEEKPSFNATATWVHGNHTYKLGAEMYLEQNLPGTISLVRLTGGLNATSLPENANVSFGGFTQGFGYASFLLGDYNTTTQGPNQFYRLGSQTWGLYLQDSWKVTRKLTVDYGLRWDYFTPQHETYGRLGQIDPTAPNANAGGRIGAVRFANTCNCPFYQSAYPFALGPRLSGAYQISPKTVFRAGFGINYQFVGAPGGAVVGTAGTNAPAGVNPYVDVAQPGAIAQPTWPVTNPSVYPVLGQTSPAPYAPDANQNRPPRITQWSVGFQREITSNLYVEASYVGNRAAWIGGLPGGPLGYLSQIPASTYAQFGLYPYAGTGPAGYNYQWSPSCVAGNDCDRALLGQQLRTPAVQAKLASVGLAGWTPYPGFSTFNTLQSALYPYPQFGNLSISGSPTGASKYDSLQAKVTKRYSHGLQIFGSFTWGQGFARPTRQDFFNPQSNVWQLQQLPLFDLNFNAVYTVQNAKFLPKYANMIIKDWQIGWFSNYQSGQYLTPPTSPTANFLSSQDVRVPNQPLYTTGVNLNDHSTFQPYYTQVLNPNAWQACPANAVCPATSTFYKDFKGPRTPTENANIGRHFRFGKDGHYDLYVRAEFVNIFNRTLLPNPNTTNPQIGLPAGGKYAGGFGVISAVFSPGAFPSISSAPYLQPRTGTLIARFSF